MDHSPTCSGSAGLPLLGVRLSAPEARQRLESVAARLSTHVSVLPDIGALTAPQLARLAALVLDLGPWDAAAIRSAEAVRCRVPWLPIIVYYPDTPKGADAAAQVSRLPHVMAKMQITDQREAERLRQLLAPLVRQRSARQFEHLITAASRATPTSRVGRFLGAVAARLAAGWLRRPPISELALAAGCSRRHLERECRRAGLPAPHRLVDWLILIWAASASAESGHDPHWTATHLALTTRDLARLSTRTAGTRELMDWRGAAANEDLARRIFAEFSAITRGRAHPRDARPPDAPHDAGLPCLPDAVAFMDQPG